MSSKTGFLLMSILLFLGVLFSFNPAPHLFTETGPFELTQALFMAVSFLVWTRLAISKWRNSELVGGFDYTIAVFFAVVSLVVLGRETSFLRVYGLDREFVMLLKILTTAVVVPILALLCIKWIRNVGQAWRLCRQFMATPNFFWVIAAFVLVLLGDVFEKEFLPFQSNLVWEEIFELMGYLAIFTGALVSEHTEKTAEIIEQEIVA